MEEKKTQWQRRVDISNYIYQCLLLEYDSEQIIFDAPSQNEFNLEQMQVIEYIANNLLDMVVMIKPFLNPSWTWERISYVDRAIMLTSIAENIVLKTPKNIAIDQALISVKQFNIDDSYKYVNAILDKVIK